MTTKTMQKAATNGRVLTLSDMERLLILGLQARDREIVEKLVAPLQADFLAAFKKIEQRLRLKPGSIGTTYRLNPEDWTVEAIPAEKS